VSERAALRLALEQGRGHEVRIPGSHRGSLLAALDVHPRVAMQILRHSRAAITMEIYTEVPSTATREAHKRLGQWLEDAQT
jgi:hypothetical protein